MNSHTKPYVFRFMGFLVFKEEPGVISPGACWVCFYGCWMHCCGSLPELIWSVLTEWKQDRNLVG